MKAHNPRKCAAKEEKRRRHKVAVETVRMATEQVELRHKNKVLAEREKSND